MKFLNKSLLVVVLMVVLVVASNVLADCTASLDKDIYFPFETATMTGICDGGNEKSRVYEVNWTSANGTRFELDSGTTPANINEPFFETFVIPEGFSGYLNVNLTGTNLEGTDFANVTEVNVTNLRIENIIISAKDYIGKWAAIVFTVKDSADNPISNSQCIIDIVDKDNLPIVHSGSVVPSQGDGKVLFSSFLDEDIFVEGLSYKWDVACTCFDTDDSASIGGAGFCYDSTTGIAFSDFAHGESQQPFTVNDVGDSMVVKKWGTEFTIPHVYIRNERSAKVNISSDPSYISQKNINWSLYNNSFQDLSISENGNAFVTAGKLAKLCFIVNNTFDKERTISVFDVTFDTDEKEEFFHPLDIDTFEVLMGEDNLLLKTTVKPWIEENLTYERCTEWFRIPDIIKGANDWDVQARIRVDGFDQDFGIESDEFPIYGARLDEEFVRIIDISRVSSDAYKLVVDACSDVSVNFSYSFFGDVEEKFDVEYCFEQTDTDVIEGCFSREIIPDEGSDNVITDVFKLPFFASSGAAEVTIEIFNRLGLIVGFADTEPFNTFNVSAVSADSCRFSESLEQELSLRGVVALEGIENKTGIFKLRVDCPERVVKGNVVPCVVSAVVEDPDTPDAETNFNCYIDNHEAVGGKNSEFNFFRRITSDPFEESFDVLFPLSLGVGVEYAFRCEAQYFSGLDTRNPDKFSDSVLIIDDGDSVGGRGKLKAFFESIYDSSSFWFWFIVGVLVIFLLILTVGGKLLFSKHKAKEGNYGE